MSAQRHSAFIPQLPAGTDPSLNIAAAYTKLSAYLERKGLRRTTERFAIYGRLLSLGTHTDPESLHQIIERSGFHVSRASVYNTLNMLVDSGLVRRHKFDSGRAQYEAVPVSPSPVSHHHLVCSVCGKVREAACPEIDTLVDPRRYGSEFVPQYAEVTIYGVCRQCARRMRRSERQS